LTMLDSNIQSIVIEQSHSHHIPWLPWMVGEKKNV
jgi:hypothetical protein